MSPQQKSELIPYLKTVDTPTLSNAIEELNIRPRHDGFAPLSIRCMFPELGRMCGYAVTAHVETVSRMMPSNRADFLSLFEALDAAPKPAVVVLQETGHSRELAAHCGEVMATIFTRLGAVGLITDAAVRDIPEVRAMGMQYFARGAVASHAWYHLVRVNVPVHLDGFVVRPNDLLHGDENGIIQVPDCNLEELTRAVDSVRGRERRLMDFVRGSDFNIEALRTRFLE